MENVFAQKREPEKKAEIVFSPQLDANVGMKEEALPEAGVPLFMQRDHLSSSLTLPNIQCRPENEEEEEKLHAKPLANQNSPLIQRQEELPEEEELQAKSKTGDIPAVESSLESRINSLKGGGRPLSESEHRFFGPRFGMNFSKVRIHDDTQTAKAAQDIHARVFTFGHNIVFGAGEYAPNTVAGRKLLAHELTHSIQQRGASKTGHIQRSETKAEQAKRLKEVNKAALTTAVAEIKVSTAKPHWAKKNQFHPSYQSV